MANAAADSALRLRWGNEWKGVRDRIALNLFLHLPLLSGLKSHAKHEGRFDFRGMVIQGPKTCRRASLENVDFSYANLPGWWMEKCRFTNVLFLNAKLAGLRDHGNLWSNVNFSFANLSDSGIGFRHSKFEGCYFDRSRFAGVAFSSPVFTDCVFENCSGLEGADFNASSFEHCKFIGTLDDVVFRNGFLYPSDLKKYGPPAENRMTQTDWTQLRVGCIAFTGGVKLDKVILPKRQTLIVTYNLPKLLEVLKPRIDSLQLTDKQRAEFEIMLKSLTVRANTGQRHYIIEFVDMMEILGEEAVRPILEIVRDANSQMDNKG